MSAPVHATETTFTKECFLLVLVDDLSGVEIPALVIVVQNLTISQVEHIIVVKQYALRGIHTTLRGLFEFQLSFNLIDELVDALQVDTEQIKLSCHPLLGLVSAIHLHNYLQS